jgi:hypothetical protein
MKSRGCADLLAGTAGVIICWVVGEPSSWKAEGNGHKQARASGFKRLSSRAVGGETLKLPRTLCDEAEVEG